MQEGKEEKIIFFIGGLQIIDALLHKFGERKAPETSSHSMEERFQASFLPMKSVDLQ